MTATTGQSPRFVFAACQMGAEKALIAEMARARPALMPAYRRPGLVTFKLPAGQDWPAGRSLDAVFARTSGLTLGTVRHDRPDARAAGLWRLAAGRPFRRVHVWHRDPRIGESAEAVEDPVIATCADEARQAILGAVPADRVPAAGLRDLFQPAGFGDLVLDCVVVEPDAWWVGYHRARSSPSRWPGGVFPSDLPEHAVSRAWLKMEEALAWSAFPLRPGARWAELGSAPGGASQALLDRGMAVTGIDPAEMDPMVLAHPRFTHVRRRSTQVPRRVFRKVRWLASDMNVTPQYTLTAVEAVVTHPEVRVRGLLLTLKLSTWDLAGLIPEWLSRVRSWGFNQVRARQLSSHRREICVAALCKPFRR